jgi:hypothetical protein
MSIYRRGGTKFVDYCRNPTIELVIPFLQIGSIANSLFVGTGRPRPHIVGAGDKYHRSQRKVADSVRVDIPDKKETLCSPRQRSRFYNILI